MPSELLQLPMQAAALALQPFVSEQTRLPALKTHHEPQRSMFSAPCTFFKSNIYIYICNTYMYSQVTANRAFHV